jgi:hypothetical protein
MINISFNSFCVFHKQAILFCSQSKYIKIIKVDFQVHCFYYLKISWARLKNCYCNFQVLQQDRHNSIIDTDDIASDNIDSDNIDDIET